jgi:hypothetical protein
LVWLSLVFAYAIAYSAKTDLLNVILKRLNAISRLYKNPFRELFTIWLEEREVFTSLHLAISPPVVFHFLAVLVVQKRVEHRSVLERIIQHIDELNTTWKWLFNHDLTFETLSYS